MLISTDAKEDQSRLQTCLSKIVRSGFSLLGARQLGMSRYEALCNLSRWEFLSIKNDGKTVQSAVGRWRVPVSCEVAPLGISFLKLHATHHAVASEAVLFCFLLSLSLLCLLTRSILKVQSVRCFR